MTWCSLQICQRIQIFCPQKDNFLGPHNASQGNSCFSVLEETVLWKNSTMRRQEAACGPAARWRRGWIRLKPRNSCQWEPVTATVRKSWIALISVLVSSYLSSLARGSYWWRVLNESYATCALCYVPDGEDCQSISPILYFVTYFEWRAAASHRRAPWSFRNVRFWLTAEPKKGCLEDRDSPKPWFGTILRMSCCNGFGLSQDLGKR